MGLLGRLNAASRASVHAFPCFPTPPHPTAPNSTPPPAANGSPTLQGDQTLCFANDGQEARAIGFAFRADAELVPGDVATEDNVKCMFEIAKDLTQGLDMLGDHQEFMRIREEVHRGTVTSTNSKVLWWTVVEAVVLAAMSVWQIMYIRKFFEVKRYL